MEWISVKDKLPNQLDMVLVFTTTSLLPTMAYRFEEDNWFYYSVASGNFPLKSQPHIKVLYWMPLPNPPKQLTNPPTNDKRN